MVRVLEEGEIFLNLKKIFTFGRMGIRKQVLYLLLSCSIMTLFVAGGIALYGIFNVKSNALEISTKIGESAATTGSDALKKVTIESLEGLVHERAKRVDYIFNDFIWDVKTVSEEMTAIMQNPQNYPLRRVYEANAANADKYAAQLIYADSSLRNDSALQREIGLAANAQDFLVRIAENDKSVMSIYATSKNGFTIVADDSSAKRVDENNNPLFSDFRPRTWYQKASTEKKITFSDVFLDFYGRGLTISCAGPYYDMNGNVAGVVGEGRSLKNVSRITNGTKIGETGFGFILSQDGHILFSPKTEGVFAVDFDDNLNYSPSLFEEENPELANVAKLMAKGSKGTQKINLNGKEYYISYNPLNVNGWSFGVVMDVSEIVAPAEISKQAIEDTTNTLVDVLNSSIKYMITAMLSAFIAVIILVSFAGRTIADKFTKPLHELTDGVREIASGNLDKKLDIHTGELQTYMNNLTKVTAEKERIATELNVAKNIQVSMLPKDFDLGNKNFELYAKMNAAKEVGGDFYDFYMLDENHLVVTMADVSGKGVPAALFMMRSKTILKNLTTIMTSPDDFSAVVHLANDQLCQNNDAMMFVTVFTGMLDLKTGEFIFVNGGHNPPIVYKKETGKCEYVKVAKNFVLGGMDDLDFSQQSITLDKGDIIYLYTDGVTEAFNAEGEQYTEPRLLDCLNRADKNLSMQDLLKFVREDVNKHVAGFEQSDDITMLGLKFK